jgi:hypothetical protein
MAALNRSMRNDISPGNAWIGHKRVEELSRKRGAAPGHQPVISATLKSKKLGSFGSSAAPCHVQAHTQRTKAFISALFHIEQ